MKAKAIRKDIDKSDIGKLIKKVRDLKLELRASTESVKKLTKLIKGLNKKCAAINTNSRDDVTQTHTRILKGI